LTIFIILLLTTSIVLCVYFYIVVVFKFQGGGPIIAVQVENEYGSYAKDDKYMAFIKNVIFYFQNILLQA
jgi:hypothetical protein